MAAQGATGATGATGAQGPQGTQGAQGPQGTAGATGATGAAGTPGENANTITAAGFTVPTAGNAVTVPVADAGWVSVGQLLYVDQAGGGAGLSGALVATAKTGTSVTLQTPSPTPTIPTAGVGQAGLVNALSGNATDYLGGDNATHPLAVVSGFSSLAGATTLTLANRNGYFICTGGSWTLSLPAPVAGLCYSVRNDMGIAGTVGTITIAPASGLSNGAASLALLPQQECLLVSDGTNWRTRGLQRTVVLGTQDITNATTPQTFLLPVGYRIFEVEFILIPATANDFFVFQASLNGGSSWLASLNYFETIYNATTTTLAAGSSLAATAWPTLLAPSAGGNFGSEGKLTLFPGNASQYPRYRISSGGYQSNLENQWHVSGMINQAGPVNALRYVGNAGNIAAGFVTVKGIV